MRRRYTPVESLPAWARLNGVDLSGITFDRICSEDATDKGTAIIAQEEKSSGKSTVEQSSPEILIRVPSDLVLSLQSVENHAKLDPYLREVLSAACDFGRTARGAILIFLLLQLTYSSPDFNHKDHTLHRIGVSDPWSEYIKFLPAFVLLPTFYTREELDLLYGSSLSDAADTKLASLEREFDHLRTCTEHITWCMRDWWDVETGKLTFDDWKQVDAMYRSRMLDLPGTGHSMVPCIDMANHASGDSAVALYETDGNGNAVLQLRRGKILHLGDEITISYGEEKGASEMIFSYGFLENELTDARQLFLGLDIPDDDPLKLVKKIYSKDVHPPGVRLSTSTSSSTSWESSFIWWSCINEEDGLSFKVLQTVDGQKELTATWKGRNISRSHSLKDIISTDPLWHIFQLRAVIILQNLFETRLSMHQETEKSFKNINNNDSEAESGIRRGIHSIIMHLRRLETDLLTRGISDLIQARDDLMASEAVISYFARQQQENTNVEDGDDYFS